MAHEETYKGHVIYTQAGEFFPVRVTFLRPDGYSAEPRAFRTAEAAKEWVDTMGVLADAEG